MPPFVKVCFTIPHYRCSVLTIPRQRKSMTFCISKVEGNAPLYRDMRRSSSGSSFEIGKQTPKQPYIPSMLGRASTCALWVGTIRTLPSQISESASSYGSYRDARHMSTSSATSTPTSTSHEYDSQ